MQEFPDFKIVTVPTNCEVDIGEATYVALNEVEIAFITWSINETPETVGQGTVLGEGTSLSQLPKADFSVTATSSEQCQTTKFFAIEPDILVFNGISRNGDGQNDIFEISCIQDFPNNTVKIFNRAGTLVYETKGYDNSEKYFNGTSNEGLSLMGKELPDGTYFYIIDKGNGSKPRTGYLELLRQ
jgi:gliding motility-associated-like protein